MSDPTTTPARPVSLFTIVFLFVLFGAFFLVVRRYYHAPTAPVYAQEAENFNKDKSKDLEWRTNRDTRRAYLNETRKETAQEATTYGWVDKDKGVVRLPLDRAMELTAQKYGRKQ